MKKILLLLVVVAVVASTCGDEASSARIAYSDEPRAQATIADSSFPAGWHAIGVCTSESNPFRANRDSVLAHLDTFRRHGVNTLIEPAAADGRIIPRGESPGWYNWYGYSFVDHEGRSRRHGHPRPGAYVEGMRWLLDRAYADGQAAIRVIIALDRFVAPGYKGDPFDGDEQLRCSDYRSFIADEKQTVAQSDPERSARIPAVQCPQDAPSRPFWEWNIRYVVQNLSRHPGLLAWYLWDEPEGIGYRHLFGIAEDKLPRSYTGTSSLPTTDFLRYSYELVRDLDRDAGGDNPVIVDIYSPHVFFSDRFSWSVERRDPRWSSGPFDIAPDGSHNTPADILGLEGSGYSSHTQAAGAVSRLDWYWDPNLLSRAADMLHEVTVHDGLRPAMVVAGQAQLPSSGPYSPAEDLRCNVNDATRARLLNDRDLVWHFLTPLINGLRGYIYYSHMLMPSRGPGGEQVARSNRLIRAFRELKLDDALVGTARDDFLGVQSVQVEALTNYFRSDHSAGRTAKAGPAGPSALSRSMTVEAEQYDVRHFGRSGDPETYGQAAAVQRPDVHPDHHLLRTTVREHEGYTYVFLSNSYDARIRARMSADARTSAVDEALFDLSQRASGRWTRFDGQAREAPGNTTEIEIEMDPYEAKVFRFQRD